MKDLPILFIFDLDNTLIGNGLPLSNYLHFISLIKDGIISEKIKLENNKKIKLPSSKQIIDSIPNEYYRPYLKELFETIKELFPSAEFFIYSAGTKNYVNLNILYIEKKFNIKFNRPIFSRDDCIVDEKNTYKKSVVSRYSKIFNSLKSKYHILNNKDINEEILENRIIFFDDSDVLWDHQEKWIQCPKYNYEPIIDYTQFLSKELLSHPIIVENFKNKENGFAEVKEFSENERDLMYHTYMAELNRNATIINIEASKDIFFKKLIKVLKTKKFNSLSKPFNKKQLDYINKFLK